MSAAPSIALCGSKRPQSSSTVGEHHPSHASSLPPSTPRRIARDVENDVRATPSAWWYRHFGGGGGGGTATFLSGQLAPAPPLRALLRRPAMAGPAPGVCPVCGDEASASSSALFALGCSAADCEPGVFHEARRRAHSTARRRGRARLLLLRGRRRRLAGCGRRSNRTHPAARPPARPPRLTVRRPAAPPPPPARRAAFSTRWRPTTRPGGCFTCASRRGRGARRWPHAGERGERRSGASPAAFSRALARC